MPDLAQHVKVRWGKSILEHILFLMQLLLLNFWREIFFYFFLYEIFFAPKIRKEKQTLITKRPTDMPTEIPTDMPTVDPSMKPTNDPTSHPTNQPTNDPSSVPTATVLLFFF